MNVANVFCLLNGWKFVEDVLSVYAVAAESIDGKVADAKRGKVLEEVRALAWVNLEAVKACLHDNLCCADMTPLNGNTEPWVAASPTSGTDEEIGRSGWLKEPSVYFLNLFGNSGVVGGRVTLGLDVNDVLYVVEDAVTDC